MEQIKTYSALSDSTSISANFLHPIVFLRGQHVRQRAFCEQLGTLTDDIWQTVMKHGLLQSTALAGAAIAIAGAAMAAEAPTWKLSDNATFNVYYVDQDFVGIGSSLGNTFATTNLANANIAVQDHDWYLGVDEAGIHLNVLGTADNGLKYGFKIEINANTDDSMVADEVPFSIGVNYTDNSDSGQAVGSSDESAYWNVAAAFVSGPLYLSVGYFASAMEFGAGGAYSEFTNIALTADYTVVPGLGLYAEIDLIEYDVNGGCTVAAFCDNDATVFIAGANVSF